MKRKPAPPVRYSEALGEAICLRLEEGEALNEILRGEGMPTRASVLQWVQTRPDFSIRYARAREIGYTHLAEEILEIANTPVMAIKTESGPMGVKTTEADAIEHRRLQIDTRKWLLAKMLPKVYGQKNEPEAPPAAPVTLSSAEADV